MAALILPSRRSAQPLGPVRLAPAYASVAEACIDFRGVPIEIAQGKTVTVGTALKLARSFQDRMRAEGTALSLQSYASVPIKAIGTGDFTWLMLSVWHETWAQTTSYYQYAGDLGDNASPAFEHPDFAGYQNWWNGTTGLKLAPSTGRVEHSMHAWRRTGTTIDGWVDGKIGADVGTGQNQNITATTWNVGGALVFNTASLHPAARFAFAILLRASLPNAELAEIGRFPYGPLFVRDPKRTHFGVTAGGGTTDCAIAGTQATDVGAVTVEATTGCAIAGTQATDVGAVTVEATTGCAITGTQSTDVGAITVETATNAAVAGTQSTDVGAITVEATTGAAIAGTQATDVGAIAVEATTGAAIAGTQASDGAAVQVTASTGETEASVAGTQATDVGAITVEATLGLSIAGTQASDLGYIVVEATLPASMAGTQASDVAAITVQGTSIWTDVGVSATTWGDVGGATSIWTYL